MAKGQETLVSQVAGHRRVSSVVHPAKSSPPELATELFAPIAANYERWARLLSLGQDARWRSAMVNGLGLPQGSRMLDVAAGTGSITRLLGSKGLKVVSVDQSQYMLGMAVRQGATAVVATAEQMPFAAGSFDGVTFGYLLRYVDDVSGSLSELVRLVRPGGTLGMVEFGRPSGVWRPVWWLYTRLVLPVAGLVIGSGWRQVGQFLGPSIDKFARRYSPQLLADEWRTAGLEDVVVRRMSLGGGLVMWGRRP